TDNRHLRLPNIRSTLPTAITIVITLLRTREVVQGRYSTLLYGRLEVRNSTHAANEHYNRIRLPSQL
ncbi:hypothetical protein BDD12DRAFT_851274, partial [Trichophaea hybrida]